MAHVDSLCSLAAFSFPNLPIMSFGSHIYIYILIGTASTDRPLTCIFPSLQYPSCRYVGRAAVSGSSPIGTPLPRLHPCPRLLLNWHTILLSLFLAPSYLGRSGSSAPVFDMDAPILQLSHPWYRREVFIGSDMK